MKKIRSIFALKGLSFDGQNLCITAGGNQGYTNICLALTDPGDTAVLIAPYYMCHLTNLQLASAKVKICSFEKTTLAPNWEELEEMMAADRPKMIVVTTPNNPSGFVWDQSHCQRLTDLCRKHSPDTWLVFDETYFEFYHRRNSEESPESTPTHFFPNSRELQYPNIIHLFSFSKTFGMPGWRVGFLVFPDSLTHAMRKLQDSIPSHPAMISQKLALEALKRTYFVNEDTGLVVNQWLQQHLNDLQHVRESLYSVLQPFGTVETFGSFYFLVPLPPMISEEEAVDILARQYGVLLMYGSPFGAKDHLRLSYGGIPPDQAIRCKEKLRLGLEEIKTISDDRIARQAKR